MLVFFRIVSWLTLGQTVVLGHVSHRVESERAICGWHVTSNYRQNWESSNRLQTEIIPRRRFGNKSDRLQSQLEVVFRAYLDRISLCQYHGLVKSKMLFSHSSTEGEILSLDAALRIEGIPALNLLEPTLIFCTRKLEVTPKPIHQTQIRKHHDPFGDIDYVLANVRFFSMRTALSVFEVNEAAT